MFTVKVCNPGMTTYYETDAVSVEAIESGHQCVQFFAQGENRSMAIRNTRENPPESDNPVTSGGIPLVNRIYLINDHGKTVDIFR